MARTKIHDRDRTATQKGHLHKGRKVWIGQNRYVWMDNPAGTKIARRVRKNMGLND